MLQRVPEKIAPVASYGESQDEANDTPYTDSIESEARCKENPVLSLGSLRAAAPDAWFSHRFSLDKSFV
jgi:hypothetical protein